MWEASIAPLRGGNFVRSILAFFVTLIVTLFMATFLHSSPAHAADAGWDGDAITYNTQTYRAKTANGSTPPGLANGKKYYVNVEVTNAAAGEGKAHLIYFANDNAIDTSNTATYETYTITGGENYGSRTDGPTSITITPKNKAASSTRATWQGVDLVYDGRTYRGEANQALIANGTTPAGLASGVKYYLNVSTSETSIIYFPSGSDPYVATTAKYQAYEVKGEGLGAAKGTAKSIDVTPAAESPNGGQAAGVGSTCAIDGIGWIVCPISTWLATGMDWIFDQLKAYMLFKPLTNQTNSLYLAWTYAQSFANIAFVIAFIIIIYSQLTGLGISNYGIKKLLPKLIVAVILVNISYYICSIAIDLSNIIGSTLQELFVHLREALTGRNPNDIGGWTSITGFILAGGAATAAGVVGAGVTIAATGASPAAAAILLLPMLAGLLLAVLIALIVLAVRQALLTLLVIVSPLAFVAMLLPNTDEWFDRWRKLFTTLLVFFPLFSLIFGGSQLAGWLIIQNTDQLNIILLGLFVQVAPIVITPMLVKLSGSLVGRIAGIVNNPSKGLIDRTRKWSNEKSAYLAKRNMARTDPVRRRQVFRRAALSMDQMKRSRTDRAKAFDEALEGRWTNTAEYSDIQQRLRFAQDTKTRGVEGANLRYEASKAVAGAVQNLDVELRDIKLRADNAKLQADVNWDQNHSPAVLEQRLRSRILKDQQSAIHSTHDAEYEEFKAGHLGHHPATASVGQMLQQTENDTRLIAMNAMRSQLAKRVQQETLTGEYLDNTIMVAGQRIRSYAGGIHAQGAERVLAQALSEQHKARAESVANAEAIIEHLNLNAAEETQIANNISVRGITITDDIKEAAIKRVMGGGVVTNMIEVLSHLDMSATGNENHRVALVEALRKNPQKPKWFGMGWLDAATQGVAGAENGMSPQMIDGLIRSMIVDGKLSAKELVSQDKDVLIRVNEALSRIPRTPDFEIALRQLRSEIVDARRNAQMWNVAGERKRPIEDIERTIS
jgi:hypothetical protein